VSADACSYSRSTAALLAACATNQGSDAGLVTLVDGVNGLENFTRVGDANWRGGHGAVFADAGPAGYLVTKKVYRDFRLFAEFWAERTTNSGIMIRCSDLVSISGSTSYEINIWTSVRTATAPARS